MTTCSNCRFFIGDGLECPITHFHRKSFDCVCKKYERKPRKDFNITTQICHQCAYYVDDKCRCKVVDPLTCKFIKFKE
jgi:hypothetical protein